MSRLDGLVTRAIAVACGISWLKWHSSALAEPLAVTGLAVAQLAAQVVRMADKRPGSARMLKEISRDVRKEFLRHASAIRATDEVDIAAAEELLCEHLPECLRDHARLAACVTDARGFNVAATEALLKVFSERGASGVADGYGKSSIAQSYYEAIIRTVVDVAVRHEDYFSQLESVVLLELGRSLGRVELGLADLQTQAAGLARQRDRASVATEEQFGRVDDRLQRIEELLQKLAAREHAPPELLRALARERVTRTTEWFVDEIEKYLATKARGFRDASEGLASIGHDDPDFGPVYADAHTALEHGEISKTYALLENAERTQAHSTMQQARRLARIATLRGQVALLVPDYRKAAADFDRAVHFLEPFAPDEILDALIAAATTCQGAGIQFPDVELLSRASELWQRVAKHRAATNQQVSSAYNNLGSCRTEQSARIGGEDGTELLKQGVAAFRASLDRCPASEFPEGRATVQANLAAALNIQSNRSREAAGVRLSNEALAEIRAALRVFSRERTPKAWAEAQNCLGQVLLLQGERIGGSEGDRRLAAATEAFQASLTVFTRQSAPRLFVGAQNNLSYVLLTRGARTAGPRGDEFLNAAVAASRAALDVATPDNMPVDRFKGLNNLSVALFQQARRASVSEVALGLVSGSIAACREAAGLITRENMPAEWAKTQNNLAIALEYRVNLKPASASVDLEEAAGAYDAALGVYTRLDMPVDRALVQNNLGGVYYALACHATISDTHRYLDAAMKCFRQALKVRTCEHRPVDWATTTYNMGCALYTMACIELGRARRKLALEAISAFEQALEVRTREQMPRDWERTYEGLLSARRLLE